MMMLIYKLENIVIEVLDAELWLFNHSNRLLSLYIFINLVVFLDELEISSHQLGSLSHLKLPKIFINEHASVIEPATMNVEIAGLSSVLHLLA